MKKAFRNLVVGIIMHLGIAWLYRCVTRRKGPLVRVLAFHDVPNQAWFESAVAMLDARYNMVTPDEFEQNIFSDEQINILLTFDDGYESWVTVAKPVLALYNIKALFFVTSGLLDAEDHAQFMRDKLLLSPRAPLSWAGAAALIEAGHSIGGHTRSHTRLASCEKTEAQAEIEVDKERLEQMLARPVQAFAYPFGTRADYTNSTTEAVVLAGFTTVYIAEPGWYQPGQRLIRRTLVETNQSLTQLQSWIKGGYDLFSYGKVVAYSVPESRKSD